MATPDEPENLIPKEGVVLDREGRPLAEPSRPSGDARFRSSRATVQYTWKSRDLGLIPRVVFGSLFFLVFLLGLFFTVIGAGVAIVVLILSRAFRSR